MSLPKRETTFEFEHTGEIDGKKYEGKFTIITALNMGQKHRLELEKTRLMADSISPTDGLAGAAIILSKLRTHIIYETAPEWWKQSSGGSSLDEDLLVSLYDKVVSAENKWREDLKKQGEQAKQQNTQEEEKKAEIAQ